MSEKLLYKYKYLKLELKDIQEEVKEYNIIFDQDFAQEIKFLEYKNSNILKKKKDVGVVEQDVPPSSNKAENCDNLKEIYKKIAKKIHPDVKKDSEKEKYEELFRTLKEAYNKEDYLEMVFIAEQEGIEIPSLPQNHKVDLEKSIRRLRRKIRNIQSSVSWMWSIQLKPQEKNKSVMYESLGINKEEFRKWRTSKLDECQPHD